MRRAAKPDDTSRLSAVEVTALHKLPVDRAIRFWDEFEAEWEAKGKLAWAVRALCLADLYYLLVRVCGRVDMLPCVGREGYVDNQFAFERCREVEGSPDGYVDLWAREHWKTSVGTFGLTLQSILQNPEVTIGIFSHTRPIAKAFLRTLMREIENNVTLHAAFPDIFFGTEVRKYAKFSEDDGVIVKRKGNPNEATIEAWGLVDGMPVSKHWSILLYDDIVVQGSVTTPDMIEKTRTALELSYNLGTATGVRRMYGTRYHFNDCYRTVIDRGSFKSREYPGRIGGTEDGESLVWSDSMHQKKRTDMGPYVYATQILLNPKADAMQGFKRDWLRHYKTIRRDRLNWYILVDSANSKKRESDYTAMWAVGLGTDGNYYCIPEVRDRLNLKERADKLFALHRKYRPRQVRYEKYGMMADIEHMKSRMELENYRFDIIEVAGQTSKDDRIKRLLPLFEAGRVWLPESLHTTDWQKVVIDLVQSFIEEEYVAFPVSLHKDMLDSLARIAEPELFLVWPRDGMKPLPTPKFPEVSAEHAWMA